ncbi:hypothetical protein B2D07_00015 [Desulfococcus multivorans]|jgi:hypothetical protein|nr:hypothetical protein B2D07_00015 [Desulfococcus multivorans]
MVMERRLVDTLSLDNGLTLKLYDGSRKIAADRWQVACIANVAVPVDFPDPEMLSRAGMTRNDISEALGDPVLFEKVLERNFVDASDLKPVTDGLFQSVVDSLVPYLSRPDFPGRFLIRKYQEYRQQTVWRKKDDLFFA